MGTRGCGSQRCSAAFFVWYGLGEPWPCPGLPRTVACIRRSLSTSPLLRPAGGVGILACSSWQLEVEAANHRRMAKATPLKPVRRRRQLLKWYRTVRPHQRKRRRSGGAAPLMGMKMAQEGSRLSRRRSLRGKHDEEVFEVVSETSYRQNNTNERDPTQASYEA